jgi:RND family efflux transporter MFP subunit
MAAILGSFVMRILSRGSAFLAALLIAVPLTSTAADIKTVTVGLVDLPRVYRLDGIVEAVNQGTIAAQTSGRVIEVRYDVDDIVEEGDVLIVLDDAQQQAAVSQARANVEAAASRRQDAEQEFRRIRGVFEKEAVSQATMDRVTGERNQAVAAEKAAEAALQQAEQDLAYTRVLAPYRGVVTDRLIEVGEIAQRGSELMSGISLDSLRISVDVPQNLIGTIRDERKAQAHVDGRWIPASEVTVFPIADPRSDTFEVRMDLPEGTTGIFPGMYVKVGFTAGVDRALVIPLETVVVRSEVIGVYVVDAQGHIRLRHVRLGSPAGRDHVTVLAGLNEGERVAVDPVAAVVALKGQRTAQVGNE